MAVSRITRSSSRLNDPSRLARRRPPCRGLPLRRRLSLGRRGLLRCRLVTPAHAVCLRPGVPLRNGVTDRPEEVVGPAVTDELEALLQIRRELFVVVERTKVLAESAVALEVEDRARVVYDCGDLRPAPDHARIRRQRVDLAVSHSSDALDLE